MRRYLLNIILAALLGAVTLSAFVWCIDPYWIYHEKQVNRINRIKPEIEQNQRVFKTLFLRRTNVDVLLLGTSRMDRGMDPAPDRFGGRVFNAGTNAQSYLESLQLYELASARHIPGTLVLGVDFFVSNALLEYPANYTDDNFSAMQPYRLLFSAHALKDALLTLGANLGSSYVEDIYQANGHHAFGAENLKKILGHRQAALTLERNTFAKYLRPPPSCDHQFVDPVSKRASMRDLRRLIALAYRQHTNTYLYISPAHARFWELVGASALWPRFEDWKRELVRINEEEAQKAGAPAFPIWDFSGYSSITVEAFPALGGKQTVMANYWESSHFKTSVGNLVLERLFGSSGLARPVPADFGVRLSGANIDAQLQYVRDARAQYRRSHPQDVAEIESMVREVSKTKQCRRSGPG